MIVSGMAAVRKIIDTLYPYHAEEEHVGISPTRQTLLAPSVNRREVFGVLRGGGVLSLCMAVVVWPQTLASLLCQDESRRVFTKTGRHCLHQARSAVRCSTSRMKGVLHPSKNRS